MDLPRQPEPVKITAEGDKRDVEYYLRRIKAIIERGSYDNVVIVDNTLTIYPRAVND
jgi:hypothetical protein